MNKKTVNGSVSYVWRRLHEIATSLTGYTIKDTIKIPLFFIFLWFIFYYYFIFIWKMLRTKHVRNCTLQSAGSKTKRSLLYRLSPRPFFYSVWGWPTNRLQITTRGSFIYFIIFLIVRAWNHYWQFCLPLVCVIIVFSFVFFCFDRGVSIDLVPRPQPTSSSLFWCCIDEKFPLVFLCFSFFAPFKTLIQKPKMKTEYGVSHYIYIDRYGNPAKEMKIELLFMYLFLCG